MRHSAQAVSPAPDWRALKNLLCEAERLLAQRWPEDVADLRRGLGDALAVIDRARLKNSRLGKWMLRLRSLAPRLG
jgi:hypothetical protein